MGETLPDYCPSAFYFDGVAMTAEEPEPEPLRPLEVPESNLEMLLRKLVAGTEYEGVHKLHDPEKSAKSEPACLDGQDRPW
jgi:hypothetical protein